MVVASLMHFPAILLTDLNVVRLTALDGQCLKSNGVSVIVNFRICFLLRKNL